MAHFVDTNVAIYAFQAGPKAERALAILGGAQISVQVLNEFANVCRRKLGYNQVTLDADIAELRSKVATVSSVTENVHDLGVRLAFRYRIGLYDALLIASALLTDCDTFYSEDMRDGLVIEGVLTIRNPFA